MFGGARIVATARSGVWPSILAALLALVQDQTAGSDPPAGSAPAAASTAAANPPPAQPIASEPVAGTPEPPAQDDFQSIKTLPWEYSPYKIRIWLAAAPSPELGAESVAELQRDLKRRVEVLLGAPWSATLSAPPESIRYTVAICPQLINEAALRAADRSLFKDDKLILVSLSASARSWSVWTREFDFHARTWGLQVVREVRQPAAWSSAVFAAVVDAFNPLARIEDGQGRSCTIRGRATGLCSAESPAMIARGDVLQPTFRQNDRYGEPVPARTETLPFTFLQVSAADPLSPSLLTCNVHSAMRSPIRGRLILTSRRERWALKVRPQIGSTTLFIESKPDRPREPKNPLPGIEVYAKVPELDPPPVQTEDEQKVAERRHPAEFLGVTDWRGRLIVPPGGPGLRLMYLKNGGLLLARLPVVPGLHTQLVMELPDDNPRLQAEGFVHGMNSEVTDLVVQRQLIAVRMRRKISEGKFEEAEKLFEEFRGLKTLNDLQQMLNVQRERQKPSANPAVKQKIDKLYGDERELLAKYIDAELQVKLLAELTRARSGPAPDADGTPESGSPPKPEQATEPKQSAPQADETKEASPTAMLPGSSYLRFATTMS